MTRDDRLHAGAVGAGPDLVLLHGWGLHGGVWAGVAEQLAARNRVHCVDLPGHGASPPAAPDNWERWLELAAAALPERCALCGWSLGGQVAFELARRHPQRVERVAFVATTPCYVARPDWEHGMAPETLKEFALALERDFEDTLNRFLALQVRGADGATRTLGALRKALLAGGRPRVEALRAGLGFLLANDLRGRAGHVTQPALVVQGDRDTLTRLEAARWLAARLPQAKLAMIEGAGHAPFLSHPAQFVAALEGFLDG